jgi:hypothetical protein
VNADAQSQHPTQGPQCRLRQAETALCCTTGPHPPVFELSCCTVLSVPAANFSPSSPACAAQKQDGETEVKDKLPASVKTHSIIFVKMVAGQDLYHRATVRHKAAKVLEIQVERGAAADLVSLPEMSLQYVCCGTGRCWAAVRCLQMQTPALGAP